MIKKSLLFPRTNKLVRNTLRRNRKVVNVQEKDIGELQEKINKEKAHKKVQKDVTDWLIGLK